MLKTYCRLFCFKLIYKTKNNLIVIQFQEIETKSSRGTIIDYEFTMIILSPSLFINRFDK